MSRERRACRASADAAPTETAALRYRRTERTALCIETQEGDVVRLRIKVRESVSGSAREAGDAASEIEVNARSTVKIRFSVEGNLSAEELAAIEEVVAQAAELAGDFFAGGTRAAFAAAAALEIDSSTLAHVGLKLSVRERLTYSATALHQLPQAAAPEPATAPPAAEASAPAAPAPAAEDTVTEATSPATAEPPSAVEASRAEEPATPGPSPSVAAGALATIAQFIGQLLDSLAAPPAGSEGSAGVSIDLSLRLRIFHAVVLQVGTAPLPATGGETPADLALVGDTLDALAASQQPLDAHA